jgi:RHS repeat-associated protein
MRIGFTGHEKDRNGEGASTTEDALTESYNFGARSYLPNLGRFSTPDPARDPSSWSLYGYAGGSPYMFVDPDGREVALALTATATAPVVIDLSALAAAAEAAAPPLAVGLGGVIVGDLIGDLPNPMGDGEGTLIQIFLTGWRRGWCWFSLGRPGTLVHRWQAARVELMTRLLNPISVVPHRPVGFGSFDCG